MWLDNQNYPNSYYVNERQLDDVHFPQVRSGTDGSDRRWSGWCSMRCFAGRTGRRHGVSWYKTRWCASKINWMEAGRGIGVGNLSTFLQKNHMHGIGCRQNGKIFHKIIAIMIIMIILRGIYVDLPKDHMRIKNYAFLCQKCCSAKQCPKLATLNIRSWTPNIQGTIVSIWL